MTVLGAISGNAHWRAGLSLSWAVCTDVGHHRDINEDSVVAQPPLFAVADGLGGHEAGEVASRYVVERLATAASAARDLEAVSDALQQASADLRDSGTSADAGTTVTGLIFTSSGAATFNIGDSRVYRFRGGNLDRLTRDHSLVQELLDDGRIGPHEVEEHPYANVITRAVGAHSDPRPEVREFEPEPGDRYLVCSDGLTKELTDEAIAAQLSSASNAITCADELLAGALASGGRDNVTLVVIDLYETEPDVTR